MDHADLAPRPVELETPQWRPLAAVDRRVLGVLVEKAKTTPSAYPMTLNAICVGSNQKSNRDPEMTLLPEKVQDSLDRLRELGAIGEVQGDGRVAKFRHYLYKWMGVDKTELAVMAELLLRGAQTVGELRGRASRMEPIADLGALRPLLNSLIAKKLVVSLTPEGRGQVVSHALYERSELERLRVQYRDAPIGEPEDRPAASSAPQSTLQSTPPSASSTAVPASTGPSLLAAASSAISELRAEVSGLRAEVAELRKAVEEFRALVT